MLRHQPLCLACLQLQLPQISQSLPEAGLVVVAASLAVAEEAAAVPFKKAAWH